MEPASRKGSRRLCQTCQKEGRSGFFGLGVVILVLRGILINPVGEFLILKRSGLSKSWPGLWEFPGGKASPGEDERAALMREFLEETSLQVTVEGLLSEFIWKGNNRLIHCRLYTVHAGSYDVGISHEHDDFRWLSKDELMRFDDFSPPVKYLLSKPLGL